MADNIVIVGGGASGMTAAIAAAETCPDASVSILEHRDAPGKKLLATGNGRCNFTNEYMDAGCYHSDTPDLVKEIIGRYGAQWTLDFFGRLGIVSRSRGGYCYPWSNQASSVLRVLKLRLRELGVPVFTGIHAEDVSRGKNGFILRTSGGMRKADRVILACGGKAASKFGSDGSGYALAEALGHTIVPVVPALVQLTAGDHPLKNAAGVRTEAKVGIFSGGKLLAEDTGELQITSYGISGIPVMQVSRHAAKALSQGKKVRAVLDLFPGTGEEEFPAFLRERAKGRESLEVSDLLIGIFNQKLIPCLLRYAGIRGGAKASELGTDALRALTHACREMRMDITGTNGFENAQVCAGGVPLTQLDPDTMESRLVKGLYFAGEIVDVDGICGGYNLQWAWVSGYIAGKSAAGCRI